MIGIPCVVFPSLLVYRISVLILMGLGITMGEILRDLTQQARHCSADCSDR